LTYAKTTIAIVIALVAGAAFAKEGVKDPTVKAREELMDTIALNAKVLGDMAGGKSGFDAATAATAKAAIAAAAAQIPAKFEQPATDPVSEASPAIWTNWPDFVAKSEVLLAGAEALDASSLEGVQAGMAVLGGACKSCHSTYQKD
jgi:cytochrome c556